MLDAEAGLRELGAGGPCAYRRPARAALPAGSRSSPSNGWTSGTAGAMRRSAAPSRSCIERPARALAVRARTRSAQRRRTMRGPTIGPRSSATEGSRRNLRSPHATATAERCSATSGCSPSRFPSCSRGTSPARRCCTVTYWSATRLAFASGEPVIFDPAVYYGDREADLAMTELFGGFGDDFYATYRDAWPLPDGYERRRTLYNLYHVLNHLNLFGGGYLAQAQAMIARLLALAR